ncbi:multicopper oxidase family protein [Paenibacillus flagellatus]|uniref:Copper oxidase n=1 Tax=Paenibacillus flagellatus TaxID=2211139 RepID=A0A2V5KGL8_9BACL|nr:multicopper oxidase family protein [Paenibacillus flagellatus]PYI57533.1 copper oxidase [Paenibacillus flagellatus]
MFYVMYGMDFLLTLLLLIFAWIAGSGAGKLAFRKREKARRKAWMLAISAGIALFLVVCRILWAAAIWQSFGPRFAIDRLIDSLPPVVVPAIAVLAFTVPRLRAVLRQTAEGRFDRPNAAAPALVVPVQSLALGAAAGLYLVFFPPAPPYWGTGLVMAVLVLAGTVLLHLKQTGRVRKLGGEAVETAVGAMRRRHSLASAGLALAGIVALGVWWTAAESTSRLPERLNMGSHGSVDYGGGPVVAHGSGHAGHGGSTAAAAASVRTVSVADLTGPQSGTPDRRFTLTARKQTIRKADGRTEEGWSFNGQIPGPELRVAQGDLVEVVLVNEDVDQGVTVHWHGLDVPNAEDGVAGLTQDAVLPGQTHTYRFVAEQTGSFWYHSHQQSSEQVHRGLFGPLTVVPKDAPPDVRDIAVVSHDWAVADGSDRQEVKPGTPVRLRVTNPSSYPERFTLTGTPFRVAAIDGTDVNEPSELTDSLLLLAGGGRYDLVFAMPDRPVALRASYRDRPVVVLSPDGSGQAPEAPAVTTDFDPASYGKSAETPFGADSKFDRAFTLVFDSHPFSFYDGTFNDGFTINGKLFPHTPTLLVRENELIKTTFVNRSYMDHPMHLHGHHMLVLSKNGKPVTGSPWWTDTLNVAPGETYEVAFRTDNPGIWMDHCHNLIHAAAGMTMHLAYEGVTTPFEVGSATVNRPE